MSDRTVEMVAKAICKADGVDPYKLCAGLGRQVPIGKTVFAWEVRADQAIAAIQVMTEVRERGYE